MANAQPTSPVPGAERVHLSSIKKRKRTHGEGEGLFSSQKKAKSNRKSKRLSSGDAVVAIDEDDFSRASAMIRLSLAPVFFGNPVAGLVELLDTLVMQYVPAFRGVLLAHSDLRILDPKARVQGDCPFVSVDVGFSALVWSPSIGKKLTAEVNLCSPDHVSLLVHRIFNVSIPRHHIPSDEWHFEYGPAENDPEYGASARDDMEVDQDMPDVLNGSSLGWWVNTSTGHRIGGKNRTLTFTVVGMTIAHRMLSLTGSLQPDPFNPAHVPEANKSAGKALARTVVESESTTGAGAKAQSASTSTTVESPAELDSESTTAAIIQSALDMAPLPYSESEESESSSEG